MYRKNNNCMLSFIIPTLNEESFIAKNLATIRLLMKDVRYEVIVADNGSEDRTAELVRKFGAKLLTDSSKTVAGLRNLGANHAKGEILIFLDADVMITKQWVEKISSTIRKMGDGTALVTGSRCGVGQDPSPIERYWFLPMTEEQAKYVNSGHLIVEKDVYDQIGGFGELLETSEDHEFCMRAARKGIVVENDPELLVIHEGYPKTIGAFARREMWHGIEDFKSFRNFIASRVAIAGLSYCLSLSLALGLMFSDPSRSFLFLMGNFLLAMTATLIRSRKQTINLGICFLLYNVYLFSRGLSLAARLIPARDVRGRTRESDKPLDGSGGKHGNTE